KLNSEQLNILQEIVEAKNDATLGEIRLILQERTGVTIGISTVDRMLQKMEITLKKHCTPRKKTLKAEVLNPAIKIYNFCVLPR
ncbi:hypothetical protein NWP25_05375, partial [Chrysosporum ovalisporum Ak1311]|nr:hypothetical protein [Umezakia ovalisporum Ak1311]